MAISSPALRFCVLFGSNRTDSHSLIHTSTKKSRVPSKSFNTCLFFSSSKGLNGRRQNGLVAAMGGGEAVFFSSSKGLNGRRQNGLVAAIGGGEAVAATGGGDIGGGCCKYCGGSGGGGGGGSDKDYIIKELLKNFAIFFTLYNIFDTYSNYYIDRWDQLVDEELKRNPHLDLEKRETKRMLAIKASGIYAVLEFLRLSL